MSIKSLAVWLIFLVVLTALQFKCASGRDVLELQGTNLELTLTSYKYLAILFYDESDLGRNYVNNWRLAAQDLKYLPKECEIAQVRVSYQFVQVQEVYLHITCCFDCHRLLGMIQT